MLEELNQDPGEMNKAPDPPKEGIERQFIPKWIRIVIQLLCLPYVFLEIASQKIARKIIKPPFVQVGACKQRGNCCYYIRMKKARYLDFFQKFWAVQINGFFFRTKKAIQIDKASYYYLGCRHLSKEGKCNNYLLRPLICRTWPKIEYFKEPQLLKGCGYKVEVRKKYAKQNPFNILK